MDRVIKFLIFLVYDVKLPYFTYFIHESFSPAYFLLNQMITENTDVLVTV
jgi:hypothetical protein